MNQKSLFYLALITIFGAVARIWFFWKDGLHTDELFTINLVKNNLSHVITYSLTHDCNPPLFYIIDWTSVRIFGLSAFAQRLPSVIAGIVLIPVSYYLGKELKSDTLGLLTALAVSTLGSLWFYSQFGRSYMLICLFFAVFCIFYLRLVRDDLEPENWWGIVITAVLLAYTHLFAIIPVAILIGYLIVKHRVPAVKAAVLTFILSSPLLFLFKAILDERAVPRAVASQTWDWYGATVPQIVIFAPLEFFGYTFVFWIPMVVYATWIYRKVIEIPLIVGTFLMSFLGLLALSDTTPVYIRYTLLFVPILLSIGLLPVAEFLDNPMNTRAQKWFVVGSFAMFYFGITIFEFWSGLYMPKGYYSLDGIVTY